MRRVWIRCSIDLPNDVAQAGLDSEDGYEFVAYALAKDGNLDRDYDAGNVEVIRAPRKAGA